MIKANELRIGNLVKGAADKVYTVDANIISICSRSPDWVDPIPLTPEILEKAGFGDIDGSQNDYNISIEDFGVLTLRNDSDYETWWVKNIDTRNPIKYLHQLQNLYFALTGEELMIEDLNLERSVARDDDSSNGADLKKICDLYGVPSELLPKKNDK